MPDEVVDPVDHRWQIEPHEVERHVARRGRRHAFERLTPNRTALVVLDMVPFFVAASPYALGIVPRINRAAAAVRGAGGTVAWVTPAETAVSGVDIDLYGDEVAAVYATAGGIGPLASRLWPALSTEPTDIHVQKRGHSAFFPGASELHSRLTELEIDSVLIAGTVANVCCESSARDARALGYRVVVLADANAAPTDDMLNATLRTIYRSFGDVRTTAEVGGLLRASP